MDDSESNRSRSKREAEERTEAREGSRMEEDDDRNGSDKRKHRSSRSLKHSSQEETEEYDSGRRKKPESGKEDDYDVRRERESRSKVPRKSIDERSERRAGESYRESRDKEYESNSLRKSSGKGSGGREGSEGKSGSKLESSHERDGERERDKDKDLRYSERKETGREKDYGRQERDEERSRSERKGSDQYKHGSSREKEGDLRNELNDIRSRAVDSCGEKGGRSSNREDRRGDTEKNRGRSDARDEDRREVSTGREAIDDKQRKVRERSEDIDPNAHQYGAKSYVEKVERHRRDEVETKERSNSNVIDDDRHGRVKDRYGREVTRTNRSRSPEKGRRYHKEMDEHDRGYAESDSERNAGNKGKEREKENYRDDRSSKGKDNWEGSKDQWRRSQSRQDAKDVENSEFDQFKDWDSQRHDKERMVVGDQLYGRAGYRKDNRIRSDGLKKSSMSGAMNDNSDSIEIRPNRNLDFGREEMTSTFLGRRSDSSLQHNFNEEDWGNPKEDRFQDDNSTMESPSGRGRGQNVAMNLNRTGSGQSVNSGMHPPLNNQGRRGGRPAGGRGRQPGRDSPRVGLPLPMITPPFGPLSLPPGPLQPIGPNLTHSPNTLIPPGVFTPPFPGPLVWPGARGVDLNMLALPPNLPPIPPPGSGGSKFGPNMGADPGHPMYFNQLGSGRGVSSNLPGPVFNPVGPIGREMSQDKPPRNTAPLGKAPSRGEQNDYSQNFVDTGMRPQNFIRELELTNVVEDYPKLRELIQRKDEIVANSSFPPMYCKCDLKEHALSSEFFGTKFDVILVDPPWEEYVHRAPGVTDHLEYWSVEEIQNLKIEAIADTPSFIFLWVGDGVGLEQGRQCLKKWGFRRCEDICWVKTNKKNAAPGLRHDSHTLLQHSKEHCLMGIKGTVRRSTDGHIIHANIDTDIIIAEEPTDGSTKKPDDMYRIIEHFALGRRRLELFGEDHNIRSGWLTVGKGLSSSNFSSQSYIRNFADKEGKVWQGGGGRNPPPEAPHLVVTTPEIEGLRPKSPPSKSQQQQQQQSMPLMTAGNSMNRRASGNSPQTSNAASFSGMNPDPSGSEAINLLQWASPSLGRGPESGRNEYGYGFNPSGGQNIGDHIEFDLYRTPNRNLM